jgi:hypothetical protein
MNPVPPYPLLQEIIDETKRIEEDAVFCYSGHSEEARLWGRVSIWIGIPTTLLAAITGLTSLSGGDATNTILSFNQGVFVGILAFLVAAMAGLATFLDPKGQSNKHYQACITYARLWNDIRMFREIDCVASSNLDEIKVSLKEFGDRLNDLNDQTPMISERARRLAANNINAGRYIYGVDRILTAKANP